MLGTTTAAIARTLESFMVDEGRVGLEGSDSRVQAIAGDPNKTHVNFEQLFLIEHASICRVTAWKERNGCISVTEPEKEFQEQRICFD